MFVRWLETPVVGDRPSLRADLSKRYVFPPWYRVAEVVDNREAQDEGSRNESAAQCLPHDGVVRRVV